MDKLLIVDDEEIERESMAEFVDWARYGIELAGTAWNGVEAFDLIQRKRPDIVLTDIKMPVMNGIELIKKTKALFPEIEFVVLSGYGDYDYTSQAMEQGVRYYVLKPCDEEKIAAVMAKVQASLEKRRSDSRQKLEYEQTIDRLMPRAAEQILRNLLLGREYLDSGTPRLFDQLGGAQRPVRLLALRREKGFDTLEQYAVQNMLGDLLPAGSVLLDTALKKDLLLVMAPCTDDVLRWTAERVRKEFRRFSPDALTLAASREGTLEQVRALYGQVTLLLSLALPGTQELLLPGKAALVPESAAAAFDPEALRNAANREQLLFALTLAWLKLTVRGASFQQRREACALTLLALDAQSVPESVRSAPDEPGLLQAMAAALAAHCRLPAPQSREEETFCGILDYCFFHLSEADLSLSYLAHEVFYQSERNLGRLFSRCSGQRFSAWLESTRMRLAMQLLEYKPALRVGELAELLGYMPDGQYFAKAFRKQAGCAPSEWRDAALKKADAGPEKTGIPGSLTAP